MDEVEEVVKIFNGLFRSPSQTLPATPTSTSTPDIPRYPVRSFSATET